ncbi:MAG TPA: ATP synthase subunit I [Candidatus Hydrogenedentes bacterium]|nr:ATP synthase subunit I [Candidatus Hydrogenedentota bacterium]
MIEDPLITALAGLTGLALGLFFFAGLRWTLRRAAAARRPVPLLLGSFAVRVGIVVLGLALVGQDRWDRYVAALLGFLVARIVAVHVWRPERDEAQAGGEDAA